MKEIVCQNQSSSHFKLKNCLGKLFMGINIGKQCVWENPLREHSPVIRRQFVYIKYTEQMTGKQNSVKTCTKSLKIETPPIYGNRCSFD